MGEMEWINEGEGKWGPTRSKPENMAWEGPDFKGRAPRRTKTAARGRALPDFFSVAGSPGAIEKRRGPGPVAGGSDE